MSGKTFSEQLHEICTELHDTGGHYLLSQEQFDAVERAYQADLDAKVREARIDALKPFAEQFKSRLTSPEQSGFEFYWGVKLLAEYEKLTTQEPKS